MLYTKPEATLGTPSKSIIVYHTLTHLGLQLQQMKIDGSFKRGALSCKVKGYFSINIKIPPMN